MTQRDALEAALQAFVSHADSPPTGPVIRAALERAIAAYLAALPPGDEAGLVKRAREYADMLRQQDAPCLMLEDTIDALEAKDATIARLQAQLPDGMESCTILFKECEKGHGWLTATNWIQHGCPHCALATEKARADKAERNLEGRDKWLVDNGHWLAFVDSLPKSRVAFSESAPESGWIEWKGGAKCPLSGARAVDVRYDDGDEETNVPAGLVTWEKAIAYKLAPESGEKETGNG